MREIHWWRFKSPASPLFAQLLVQVQIKENIKAPRHWPYVRGIHRWPVISHIFLYHQLTSYGYVIVNSCITSFHLNCIMQLKQIYNIATQVSSRKSAATFGYLPDWWSLWWKYSKTTLNCYSGVSFFTVYYATFCTKVFYRNYLLSPSTLRGENMRLKCYLFCLENNDTLLRVCGERPIACSNEWLYKSCAISMSFFVLLSRYIRMPWDVFSKWSMLLLLLSWIVQLFGTFIF